ncbi:MAG: gamma-glutamyltransferase [Bacteroidota bacterium]
MKTTTHFKGIIAAGHRETARAGHAILEQGGNAFDAAVAAVLASFVCEPSLTSLGGGGFMNAVQADGTSRIFDFFVQTPQKRKPVEEVEFVESLINFGTTVQPQFIGKGSAAVYGCPAGIWDIHQQLGSLPLSVLAEPALNLCREGVEITPYQAYTISILEPVLLFGTESRETFGKEGRLIRKGETLFRPRLADTIDAFVREGKQLFYEGDIARRYAEDNEQNGGSVSIADLRAYRMIEREPVRLAYPPYEVLTNSPPSAGGSMIVHGLSILKDKKITKVDGAEHLSLLASVMREMEVFRSDKLDLMGNTTQVSVLDSKGNAASITSTLGGASGCNIPGTGVPTNNMLGETDLHPGGLYQWIGNQRVTSMMSPTIVLKHGKPAIVTGSGGSSRIRTAILQVLFNLMHHGMSVEEAVQHPRLHWESGVMNLEPGLLSAGEEFQLADTHLIPWESKSMFFGGVHTVCLNEDGIPDGLADPRRDGSVLLA